MSSVLLVNPFAQPSPPPPQSSGPDNSNAQSNDAVTPAQNSGNADASNTSTSNSGSGSGQNTGSGAQNQPPTQSEPVSAPLPDRPTNATSSSVVNAQTNESMEQTARARAITAQQDARTLSLIDSIAAPKDTPQLADFSKIVDKRMPDPLPTSPFLKTLSESD